MTESICHGIRDHTLGQIDMLSSLHIIEMEDTYSYNHLFKSVKTNHFFIHKHRPWSNATEQFFKQALKAAFEIPSSNNKCL